MKSRWRPGGTAAGAASANRSTSTPLGRTTRSFGPMRTVTLARAASETAMRRARRFQTGRTSGTARRYQRLPTRSRPRLEWNVPPPARWPAAPPANRRARHQRPCTWITSGGFTQHPADRLRRLRAEADAGDRPVAADRHRAPDDMHVRVVPAPTPRQTCTSCPSERRCAASWRAHAPRRHPAHPSCTARLRTIRISGGAGERSRGVRSGRACPVAPSADDRLAAYRGYRNQHTKEEKGPAGMVSPAPSALRSGC